MPRARAAIFLGRILREYRADDLRVRRIVTSRSDLRIIVVIQAVVVDALPTGLVGRGGILGVRSVFGLIIVRAGIVIDECRTCSRGCRAAIRSGRWCCIGRLVVVGAWVRSDHRCV